MSSTGPEAEACGSPPGSERDLEPLADQPAAATAAIPWWGVVAFVVAACVVLYVAGGPIIDVDVYWHILVGDAVLAGVPLDQAAAGWTLAPGPDTWVSSQWLAEVGLSWLHSTFGWTGMVLWRTVSTAVIVAVLAWATMRDRRPRAANVVPFALAAVTVTLFAQERSQQVTFAVMPLLGVLLVRGLREGHLPRWWLLLPLVALWANVHGGWVMAPVVLALVAVGRVLDHGLRDRPARMAAGLGALALLAGALTPLGPGNLVTTWTIGRSVGALAEWAPTAPSSPLVWALDALALLVLLAWTFGRGRPPRSEVLAVLALLAFSLTAFRNVTVVALLLAPLAVVALDRWWRGADATPVMARGWWRAALIGSAAVLAAALGVAATTPALPPGVPSELFARVAAEPGQVRLVTDSRFGGMALALAGGPDHVKVGLDGRAERFGLDYNREYRAMIDGQPGWERTFAAQHPTLGLLLRTDPLTGLLQRELGWRIVAEDDEAVLLEAPSR